MWSIRVLKDGAVPVGHSASHTHPIAHLALRKLQGNAAINKSSSGLCLEDPIVSALTTAVCFACKSSYSRRAAIHFGFSPALHIGGCFGQDLCVCEINLAGLWDYAFFPLQFQVWHGGFSFILKSLSLHLSLFLSWMYYEQNIFLRRISSQVHSWSCVCVVHL